MWFTALTIMVVVVLVAGNLPHGDRLPQALSLCSSGDISE